MRRRLAAIGAMAAVVVIGVAIVTAAGGPDHEREVVERFATAWRAGDYAAMHDAVGSAGRDAVAFARSHREALRTATATGGVRVGTPVKRDERAWALPVEIPTRVFGVVKGDVVLPLEGTGETVRIAWAPHLVFPGLAPGDTLRRQTELPARADLLARDGTPLAEGPDRASSLGATATAITGQIGDIPAEREDRLRELGVPDDALVGVTGLERIFDEQLLGTPGGELLAGSRRLVRREPRKAEPVRTTISIPVQEAAVTALAGRLGGIVAVEPRTGGILAAAGIGFSGLQPPGSTFKIVTLTAALDADEASPSDRFPVEDATTLSGVELQNANGEFCGGTLRQAFAHSCNSVFAPLGVELGAERLVEMAERFGFNVKPDIVTAATPSIPAADDIGDDLALGSTAIGQGRVQATALTVATMAATIALRGRRPRVTLSLDKARGRAETVRVVGEKIARTVERMMRAVVQEGTGTAAAIPGARVAGKTGTAELVSTQECDAQTEEAGDIEACPDTADPTDTDAWFAAYAPTGRPRVAVGVLLVSAGAGGETAAPAAREVLVAALRRRG